MVASISSILVEHEGGWERTRMQFEEAVMATLQYLGLFPDIYDTE